MTALTANSAESRLGRWPPAFRGISVWSRPWCSSDRCQPNFPTPYVNPLRAEYQSVRPQFTISGGIDGQGLEANRTGVCRQFNLPLGEVAVQLLRFHVIDEHLLQLGVVGADAAQQQGTRGQTRHMSDDGGRRQVVDRLEDRGELDVAHLGKA